jgi:hypothetical protein
VSPSCPGCGAACRARAKRCERCGFALVETADRGRVAGRRRGGGPARGRLPARRARAAALGVAIAAAAAFVLLSGGEDTEPRAAGGRPAAVSPLEAEMRLELRYGDETDDETAAIRCPKPIELGRVTRCELRYADGIPRAMLVRLTPRGELEADIPYPATLRR